ncbi:hypothetical protein [Piscinibacter sp.]|uniref:hypothetical protein n=1 Tax=Piscinibacter sp. TaxID=1903157 RepID=UPI00355A12F4
MNKPLKLIPVALAIGLGLAACGETSTGSVPIKKSDTKAWQGADDPYVAAGWSAGDHASWENQMRTRAQSQNEYNRVK